LINTFTLNIIPKRPTKSPTNEVSGWLK